MTNEQLIELQSIAKKGGAEAKLAIERFYKEAEPSIKMFVSITVKYIPKPFEYEDCLQEMRRIALETFLNEWVPEKASFKTIFSFTRRRIINKLEKLQEIPPYKSKEFSEDNKKRKPRKVNFFETSDEDGVTKQLADIIKDHKEQLPDKRLSDVGMRETIKNALSMLNDNERDVILLHYFDGELDYAEISEKVNRPYNTVKSDHYRALKKLMEILRHDYKE
jgi:RNA polymerase sigma factor (sigma-70 family)